MRCGEGRGSVEERRWWKWAKAEKVQVLTLFSQTRAWCVASMLSTGLQTLIASMCDGQDHVMNHVKS